MPRASNVFRLVKSFRIVRIFFGSGDGGGESKGKIRVSRTNEASGGGVYVSRTFRCRGAFHERSLMPTLPLIITLMHNAASLLFTLGRRSRVPHNLQAYYRDGGTYAVAGAVRLCRCIVFFSSQELSIRRVRSWRRHFQPSSSRQFAISQLGDKCLCRVCRYLEICFSEKPAYIIK